MPKVLLREKGFDPVGKEFRAFSIFNKALSGDDEKRLIEGIATTPTVDRHGDIVDPLGAQFAKSLPLLWQHNHGQTVGSAIFGKATEDGIPFKAKLPKVEEEGTLKQMVDHAWHSVKYDLIRAVSIGFRVLEDGYEVLRDGTYRFFKYEIFELSLVSIPANEDATIDVVRSLVAPARINDKSRQRSGEVVKSFKSKKGNPMTLKEQLEAAKKKLAAKKKAMDAITTAADGSTFDENQKSMYDEALEDAAALTDHIDRLTKRLAIEEDAETATPVAENGAIPIVTVKTGLEAENGGVNRVVKRNIPAGTVFTRMAIATALSKGNPMMAAQIAKSRFSDTPDVEAILKAAVSPVATTDPSVGFDANFAVNEFLKLLQGKTLFDRIQAKRRVAFDTKIRVGVQAATAYWVGEGAPKPVSKPGLAEVELKRHKLASLVVMTEEALTKTGWATETYVRDEMITAVVKAKDLAFVDGAAGNAVRPAAINNGAIGTIAATGTAGVDLENDLQTLYDNLFNVDLDCDNLVFLMNPKRASRIGNIKNALGQKEYPGITKNGGELDASDVLVTTRVPDDRILLVKADQLFYAQEDNMILRSSNQASIRMSDDPTADAGAIDYESMFQENKVALLAEQFVTWIRGRDAAVQEITAAAYS